MSVHFRIALQSAEGWVHPHPQFRIESCGEVTQISTKLPTYVAPSTETRVFSAEYEIGFDLVQAATLAEFQLSSKLLLVKLRVLPSGKVDYEEADYCGLATSLHATCINS